MAFGELQAVREDLGDEAEWKRFISTRCLGVLTKVDKELEDNSEKGAGVYNRDAADKLLRSLRCEEHIAHQDKWPWVAVLNPNPNEQLQVRFPLQTSACGSTLTWLWFAEFELR